MLHSFKGHAFKLKSVLVVLIGCILAGILSTSSALATPLALNPGTLNPLSQSPTEVTVSLSNSTNELRFVPDRLDFQIGQRYKLVLTNPSNSKHYFTAKDFADSIWTQKVEAGGVEIKGAIHELELKPGAQAEWVFVPLKPGNYALRCSIAGHTEAGMVGTIAIAAQAKA